MRTDLWLRPAVESAIGAVAAAPVAAATQVPVADVWTSVGMTWAQARSASWDDNSWDPFTAWYTDNTGHEALGIAVEDLTPGSLISSYDGQVIEGITGPYIRIRHNNVTVRGCRVVNGGTYGAFLYPTYNAPITGAVIEYCTLVREAEDLVGINCMYLDPAIPAGAGFGSTFDVTVRYCNASGWTQGMRGINRTTFEYNYFHDSQYPPTIHLNSIRPVGQGGRVYRNMMTEGRSGSCSMYFDVVQHNDIEIAENILAGIGPNAHPSYLTNLKDGPYAATAYNLVYRDNMFGQNLYGTVAGAPVPWGTNGNHRSGNMYWVDSYTTSSNTFHPQGEMQFND